MPESTRNLLRAGFLAGPLYLIVGYAQGFLREGFDFRRHALSQLTNGEMGWIQTANFVLTGLLILAGAVGVRRVLKGQRAGTAGPILLAIFGLGILAAAAFPADPGNGFPPGTPEAAEMTQTGMMHFMVAGIAFYAIIIASFVFAARYAKLGRTGWAVASAVIGLFFLISFSAIATGSSSPLLIPGLYLGVTAILLWHSALHRDMERRETSDVRRKP